MSLCCFFRGWGVISGNLGEKDVETARKVLANKNYSDGKYYKVIPRTDEYVVLQYRLKPQYKSLWMNEHMPNPEILLMLFVLFWLYRNYADFCKEIRI